MISRNTLYKLANESLQLDILGQPLAKGDTVLVKGYGSANEENLGNPRLNSPELFTKGFVMTFEDKAKLHTIRQFMKLSIFDKQRNQLFFINKEQLFQIVNISTVVKWSEIEKVYIIILHDRNRNVELQCTESEVLSQVFTAKQARNNYPELFI